MAISAGILSMLGPLMQGLSQQEQINLMRQVLNNTQNIPLPSRADLGSQQGPSALNDVQTDPALASAQRQALESMVNEGQQGGLTVQDRAALAEGLQRANQSSNANYGRVREGLEARGLQGGGTELAASLAAAQGGANAANTAGLNAASEARARALQSMASAGSMAGQMRGQEYSEKANAAAANDAINRYNTQARSYAAQQAYQDQLSRATAALPAAGATAAAIGSMGNFANNTAGNFANALQTSSMSYPGSKDGQSGMSNYDPNAYYGAVGTPPPPGGGAPMTQYQPSSPDEWENYPG